LETTKGFLSSLILYPFKRISQKSFWKYAAIGGLSTVATTFLLWFLVVIAGLLAVVANPVISLIIFFFKFFSYLKSGVFKRFPGLFAKFAVLTVVVITFTTALLWMFVDVLSFSVILVNPVVVALGFLLRYELFAFFGMIQK